jgi:hypothetical protein
MVRVLANVLNLPHAQHEGERRPLAQRGASPFFSTVKRGRETLFFQTSSSPYRILGPGVLSVGLRPGGGTGSATYDYHNARIARDLASLREQLVDRQRCLRCRQAGRRQHRCQVEAHGDSTGADTLTQRHAGLIRTIPASSIVISPFEQRLRTAAQCFCCNHKAARLAFECLHLTSIGAGPCSHKLHCLAAARASDVLAVMHWNMSPSRTPRAAPLGPETSPSAGTVHRICGSFV